MNGVDLARDLAMVAAQSAVALPEDAIPDVRAGLDQHPELRARWSELRARVIEHERTPDRCWSELYQLTGSRVATWLVTCCLACELHPEAAAAFSILAEDERMHLVTPSAFARIAATALDLELTSALVEATTGPAVRLGLVEIVDATRQFPVTQLALRIPRPDLEMLVHERPAALRNPLRREPPGSRACLSEQIVTAASHVLGETGVLAVRSPSPRAARQLALDLAQVRGRDAAIVEIDGDLPAFSELARVRDCDLILDATRVDSVRQLDRLVARLAGSTSVIALIPPRSESEHPAIDVAPLDKAACRAVWTEVAPADAADHLALRFRVSLDEARAAARDARHVAALRGASEPELRDLDAAIRARGARRMGPSVSVIPSGPRVSDLVVPPAIRHQLDDILAWYRAGDRGRAALGERGRSALGWGLTCLFSGPPGTGKTFAAQCLASELGLNLYRIDLAQVVSKYIGETEKALARVFAEAEAGHGILLFDEADALFGKRTQVKDAHDRYANVEVGYLLQRLEEFDGVGILTTNLRNNLDAAFVRRLRFVVEFPVPDQPWRRQLWEQSIPRNRAAALDLSAFVERFRLPGGLIHNIGIAVAHLAAAGDGVITPALLVRATYRELEKSGLPRSRAEFGPLAPLLDGVAS